MNYVKLNFFRALLLNLLIFSAGINDAQSSLLANSSGINVAVGSYNLGFDRFYPMLIVSNDNGTSWALNDNISGIPSPPRIDLNDAICTNNNCIAAGNYWTYGAIGDPINHPIFVVSNDAGFSWSAKHIAELPFNFEGTLVSVDCSNDNCTAVGYYRNDQFFPLMLTSSDSGQTWSYLENIRNLPIIKGGSFTYVKCNNENCIAVGSFTLNEEKYKPLLLISKDGGQSWSFIENIMNLPTSMKHVHLSAINCHVNNCIVAGAYMTDDHPSGGLKRHPIILQSKNYESWDMIQKISGLPSQKNDIGITHISSTRDGSFIAIGYFTPTYPALQKPILLVSHDLGGSWSCVKNLPGFPSDKYGHLNAISCNQNTCITTGTGYYEWDTFNPQWHLPIIITKDSGHSWSLTSEIEGFYGEIISVTCKNNNCILGGIDSMQPFLITSDNLGKSWIRKNITGLPQPRIMDLHFSIVTSY